MKTKLKDNQRGMASIAIAMVIMILITLLVTSVALVTRREQRRSLDRQLNTQAFNAIEAGISDAKAALSGENPIIDDDITNCEGTESFISKAHLGSANSEIGSNITYSCVLINKTKVTNYQKTVANPADGAFIVPIDADSGHINKIRVSWQEKSGGNSFTSDYKLSSTIASPVLRTVLLPNYNGKSKTELTKLSHTMFLFPKGNTTAGSAGGTSFIGDVAPVPVNQADSDADSRQGQFVSGNCNTSNVGNNSVSGKRAEYSCSVDIQVGGASKYYLVIQPLYKSASVDITAFDSSDNTLTLLNGQAIIDVTARAGDVIKRVQARIPSGESNELNKGVIPYPGAAVATVNSLCKVWTHTGLGSTAVLDTSLASNCATP